MGTIELANIKKRHILGSIAMGIAKHCDTHMTIIKNCELRPIVIASCVNRTQLVFAFPVRLLDGPSWYYVTLSLSSLKAHSVRTRVGR